MSGKRSKQKRKSQGQKSSAGLPLRPRREPPYMSFEEVTASIARVEARLREAYHQVGHPIPLAIDVFLCVACDSGAAVASLKPHGDVILGDGCPDCGRPEAGAWQLWVAEAKKRQAASR
jgi:hypothetical protein